MYYANKVLIEAVNISRNISHLKTIPYEEFTLENAIKLTEATEEKKNNVVESLKKLSLNISKMTDEFEALNKKVVDTNDEWLTTADKADLNNIEFKKSKMSILPIWNGVKLMSETDIPEFNLEELRSIESPLDFLKKYYPEITEGGDTSRAKTLFEGGDSPMDVNSGRVIKVYGRCLSFIKDYPKLCKAVVRQNRQIVEVIKNSAKNIESMDLNESVLVECSLLEDVKLVPMFRGIMVEVFKEAGVTPASISQGVDENSGDGSKLDDVNKVVQMYVRQCFTVQSAKMNALEENYGHAAKFIDTILKMKKKDGYSTT